MNPSNMDSVLRRPTTALYHLSCGRGDITGTGMITLRSVLPKWFANMCFRKGTWLIKEGFMEAEDCNSLPSFLFVMKRVELHRQGWVEVTCS